MRSSIKMNCPSCKNSILQPFVEPCCNCNDGSEFKPKTNADRIRAMTDTELEEWLTAFVCSNIAPHATARGAAKKGRLLEWLKQESEEK